MLGVADYPTKADVSERRAQRLQEEYDTALKFKKAKDKVDELEVELYNKKCEQHKLSLEIFQSRKVDILV
jgi:ribosomal protein L44E